mgnify:CR=1 FL=1
MEGEFKETVLKIVSEKPEGEKVNALIDAVKSYGSSISEADVISLMDAVCETPGLGEQAALQLSTKVLYTLEKSLYCCQTARGLVDKCLQRGRFLDLAAALVHRFSETLTWDLTTSSQSTFWEAAIA